jgi:signal transduction histidine kinase
MLPRRGAAAPRTFSGTKRPIGTLYVEATLTEVYRNLLNRTLVILASQAAKTFLVSLFILYIFHLFVTRHLITIAGFAGSYNLARPPPPLHLNRRVQHGPDELDKVADAFNALCANLQRAYSVCRKSMPGCNETSSCARRPSTTRS